MKTKFAPIALVSAMSMMLTVPVMADEQTVDVKAPEAEETALSQNEVSVVNRTEPDSGQVTQKDAITMYRLYNRNSGEHFYTSDVEELNGLKTLGWEFEGIAWYAPSTSSTPVYRLYNPNAGDHHYTSDPGERDGLTALGWIYEKIGWYSNEGNGVPIYRQYNPNAATGSHNYTSDVTENNTLGTLGWNLEGIGWYGVSVNCPPESLVNEITSTMNTFESAMRNGAANNRDLTGLHDQGMILADLVNALYSQFENRYYMFQNGRLVGYSPVGNDTVETSGVGEGQVLIFQPRRKKLQKASAITDTRPQGSALYFRTGSGKQKIQAAAGNLTNGFFNGEAISYTFSEDPNNAYEELTTGPAMDNFMNGHVDKHTHYLKSSVTRMMDFEWFMDVERGVPKYEKIGNYYYVCHSDTINVYYDYVPQNLVFWPRDEA